MSDNSYTPIGHSFISTMRELVEVPENLTETKEVPIGYILSLANQNSKWLVDGFLKAGSINFFAMSVERQEAVLSWLITAVVEGLPFLGHAVQQGAVFTHDGKDLIETFGRVQCPQNWADRAYFPFQAPLPPGCGLVRDLVKSHVKMLIWQFAEDLAAEDDWARQAAHLLKQFDYITGTEAAAIIAANPLPMRAMRSFKPLLTSGRTLLLAELLLLFAPDGRCGFRFRGHECDATTLQDLADPPEKPASEPVEIERIYWLDGETNTARTLCANGVESVGRMHD